VSGAGADSLYLWLAALITLGIYSFLYSDNRMYRVLLHTMIGLGVGYSFLITWKQVLEPMWWDPMTSGFWDIFNHHSGGLNALWILVAFLGLLWYFQFSRKYLWLSRIVIGLFLGVGAGIVFKQQFLLNMPQVTDSFRPLLSGPPDVKNFPLPGYPNGVPVDIVGLGHIDPVQSLNNIIYVVTIVAVMVYFFFSFSHDRKAIAGTARLGRWLLMISFGAFFGNTIMTRMGVFLQRLQFLSDDWAPSPLTLFDRLIPGLLYVLVPSVLAAAAYLLGRGAPEAQGPAEGGSAQSTEQSGEVST
jgi:hypothetical protein